jgi:hypothetical protein
MKASTGISFNNGTNEMGRFYTSTGNLLIQTGGTFTDSGFKLDVQGTIRSTGDGLFNDITIGQTGGGRYIKWGLNDVWMISGTTNIANFSTSGVNVPNTLTAGGGTSISGGADISGYSRKLTFPAVVFHTQTHVLISQSDMNYGGNTTKPGNIWIYPGKNTTNSVFGDIHLSHDGTEARGNVAIGSSATPAYKLSVTGAGGFTGDASNNAIYISTGKRIFFNNREVAIGESVTATYEGFGIGYSINANSGGILIGKNLSNSTFTNVVMLRHNDSGLLTATSSSTLNIGSSNTSGVAIFGATSGATTNREIAIYGTTSGAGIEGNIAIGRESQATGPYAIALGAFAIAGTGEFVAGCRDKPVSNVYFGSGNQSTSIGVGVGNPYTINGSGAYGTDFAGGNITIAGGRGTGTGTPGDVIISTATATASGTTLQSLTQRVWIKGGNGNVGIGASPNASYKLDVQGIVAAVNAMYINSASDALFYFQKNGASKWRIGNADVLDSNYFQLFDSVNNRQVIRWNNNATATFTSDFTFVGNTNAPVTVQSAQPTFLVEAIGATNSVNIDLKPSGGANSTIRNIGGSSIEFHTGSTSTERVRIATNGNVGINNNNPSQNLSVSGNSQINHAYTHTSGIYVSGLSSFTDVTTGSSPSYNSGMFYGAFQSYYRNQFSANATIPNSVIQSSQFNGSQIRFINTNTAITMTQGTGGDIRAYANQILQFSFDNAQASCSVSHVACIQILAPFYQGANNPTISNYFGLLLNDSAEYTANITITKRWAIYQNGASDNNYFKGKVIIGSTDAVGTSPLNVKNLPTSSAGLSTGDVWNDAGTLKIF